MDGSGEHEGRSSGRIVDHDIGARSSLGGRAPEGSATTAVPSLDSPSWISRTWCWRCRFSEGARPETGKNVAPLRRIEISPGVANQTRTRRPTTSAQHLVRAKPGLRIVLVGIRGEPRVWMEGALRPLPHVADHLPAAEGAVPRGKRSHGYALACSGIQVRAVGCRRLVAPWVPPLTRRESPAPIRHRPSRYLPLQFGRKAAARKATVRVCLVPIHVDHRPVRF